MGKIIKEIIEFMEKDPDGCRIEFILLNKSKENGNGKYSSCRFKSEKPTTRLFIENYLEFLGNGKYAEKEESPLRGDDVFEDTISYENKDNIKELPLILTEPTNKTIKFETLKKEHKIQSLLVTFFNSKKKLQIFRQREIKNNLLKNNRVLQFSWEPQILKLVNEDLFVIDYRMDCCLFNEKMVIFNLSAFEDIFNLKEQYDSSTSEIFDHLKNDVDYVITNIDKIEAKCRDNLTRLRRLNSIKTNKFYQTLKFEDIKVLIKDHKVNAKIDENSKSIDFSLEDFLYFFNDDILKSSLVKDRIYTVNNKRTR